MNLEERIENYVRETGFPRSLFVSEDGRIVGTWIMGNNYRTKSPLHGAYPHGYLRRIKALFPEIAGGKDTLHLFSGAVDLSAWPGDTVDIVQNRPTPPTFVDDAQTLDRVPLEQYKIVLADPPYSVEDCEHYQTTMISRNKVMGALGKRLRSGSWVVWLDQVLPVYRKIDFDVRGVIGMVKSTNHRFRVVVLFERK